MCEMRCALLNLADRCQSDERAVCPTLAGLSNADGLNQISQCSRCNLSGSCDELVYDRLFGLK